MYRKCLLSFHSLKHEIRKKETNQTAELTAAGFFYWIINQAHNYMVIVYIRCLRFALSWRPINKTKANFKVMKWNKLESSLLGGC